jgi:hypothetical protein
MATIDGEGAGKPEEGDKIGSVVPDADLKEPAGQHVELACVPSQPVASKESEVGTPPEGCMRVQMSARVSIYYIYYI